MIDTLYQPGTDAAIADRLRRPLPNVAPTLGTFAGFSHGLGGMIAGPLEAAAGAMEEAAGFGQVSAAGGATAAGGMFALPSDAERAQNNAARNKLMTEGVDMNTPEGAALRTQAKSFMPDPQTTGAAGQILGGLANFGTQAVGAGLAGPAGVVNLGVDQALTEADKLRQQGVDFNTRTAAGAVAGAAAAGSLFLPLSGATKLIRAGKGAAGGVAATAGQSEAERLILQHSGYDQVASQYDPLDPVALALGALVPAGFAVAFGHAKPAGPLVAPPELHANVLQMESAGQRFDADGNVTQGPVTATGARAQGEMQVMPKTSKDPGFGVTPAKDDSPAELARVGHDYLDAMYRRYDGDATKALAAYNDGPGNLDQAIKAHGTDWLAHLPQETQDYVARGATIVPGSGVEAAARVRQSADAIDAARLTPDEDMAGHDQHAQAMEAASDQIGRGDSVEISDIADRAMHEGERIAPFADAVDHFREASLAEESVRPNHAAFHEAAAEAETAVKGEKSAPPAAKAPTAPEGAAAHPGPEPTHLDTAMEDVLRTNPDMMVHLDGMAEPMRVADLMDHVRLQAAEDHRDAKLHEIAAQCALSL